MLSGSSPCFFGKHLGENEVELRRIALDYVKRHNTMTIATCANNLPWAATVFYASEDFVLYFISNPNVAVHCKNIAQNKIVSVTISEDYILKSISDWRKIKGIQMEAEAEMLKERKDIERAFLVYTKKFPFTSLYLKKLFSIGEYTFKERLLLKLKMVPPFSPSLDNRFYRVLPKRVFLVDNERSFERRIEIPV